MAQSEYVYYQGERVLVRERTEINTSEGRVPYILAAANNGKPDGLGYRYLMYPADRFTTTKSGK